MLAVYGFGLVAFSFLALGYGLIAFRRPQPQAWTHAFMVCEGYTVVLTAMLSAGIGLLVMFVARFDGIWQAVAWVVMIVAVAALFLAIWLALGVRRWLASYEGTMPGSAGGRKPAGAA